MQFLAIVLISTVYHSYVIYQNLNTREYILEKEHKSNKWNLREVILAFSLFTSVYNVLKVKSNEFRFISGIKFLSMTFIIIGHTLIFTFGGPIMNANFLYEVIQDTPIINTLMISKCLLAYMYIVGAKSAEWIFLKFYPFGGHVFNAWWFPDMQFVVASVRQTRELH